MVQENAEQSGAADINAMPPGGTRARWPGTLAGLILFAAGLVLARFFETSIWKLPDADIHEYYSYALAFWTHQPLLHALPAEYPPLALAPFSLTLIPNPGGSHASFVLWMGVIALVGYAWLARVAGLRAASAYACYLLLGATATVVARFDLVPALVTFGALVAARRRRFVLAYALLAAGVLLKLYPVFLLPPLVIAHWQCVAPEPDRDIIAALSRRFHGSAGTARVSGVLARIAAGCAVFAALVAGVFALAYVLSPTGTLSEFQFAGYRPIQIESTPATILWIASHLHVPATIIKTFNSYNLVGPLSGVVEPLSTLALVAGCLWVYWRQSRGHLSLDRAFLATLCVVLVTNKLFSPQYVIWVIPFAALVDGLDAFWLAIALLTTLDFPVFYRLVPQFWEFSFRHKLFDVFMLNLLLRNGLLVYVTLRAILRTSPAPDLVARAGRIVPALRPARPRASTRR